MPPSLHSQPASSLCLFSCHPKPQGCTLRFGEGVRDLCIAHCHSSQGPFCQEVTKGEKEGQAGRGEIRCRVGAVGPCCGHGGMETVIDLTASFPSAPSLQTGSRTPGPAPGCGNHRPRGVCGYISSSGTSLASLEHSLSSPAQDTLLVPRLLQSRVPPS